MASSTELEGASSDVAGLQSIVSTPVAETMEETSPFAWTAASVISCVKALMAVTVITFVVAVTAGALAPGLPTRVLNLFDRVALWPAEYLTNIVAFYLFILLSNTRAAFIAAGIGPLSVWVNGRLNARHGGDGGRSQVSLLDRFACGLARCLIWIGRRVDPGIGNEAHDFASRSSVALAAIVPFMAVGVNGTVLGIWLAEGLVQGWTAGLASAGKLLLPHGPVEFPALILASAIGLALARELVPTGPGHDCVWQAERAKGLLKSNRLAQSLGVIVGLLVIAAGLEVTGLA